ncbi:MAG: type II toxin-antitoxin system YafQ family toxin [Synergistaceae bacterium]|nr:type II toxin-antitoxin system YafQ family toxin [Synergistaceae bacterium]
MKKTTMTSKKDSAKRKRTRRFRDVSQTKDFEKDWERLEASGKHDMHRIKEAMSILAVNDGPMPPEWEDHELTGKFEGFRECHVKGDLLLVYRIQPASKIELLVFSRVATHSELFGR